MNFNSTRKNKNFPGFLFYFYILVYEIQFERISNDFLQSRLDYKQVKFYSN